MEKIFYDALHKMALNKFNDENTWEYNLETTVRWDTDDAASDVNFYVRHWLEKIANQEGFILVKKD